LIVLSLQIRIRYPHRFTTATLKTVESSLNLKHQNGGRQS
jgi:hypothetical protein